MTVESDLFGRRCRVEFDACESITGVIRAVWISDGNLTIAIEDDKTRQLDIIGVGTCGTRVILAAPHVKK